MQEAFQSSTMADEQEEDEFVPPDALIEWERFQLTPIPDQFHFHQSQSQSPSPSDPIGNGEIWSTIHEDHQTTVVFPPVNHEGIHLHHHHHNHNHQEVREIDIERDLPPSPVSNPVAMAESGWWDAGIEALRYKFVGIVSFLRSFTLQVPGGGLLRSHLPLAGTVVLLLLFYLNSRRRRRRRRESIVELIRVIKEKDEKIHRLLHQIARMNELLLATHHGIPLISKATSS